MENFLELNTNDNHIIYGTLNGKNEKKDNLIIFCHGLSGNQNEHHYFNAVNYFTNKGYDTFRFDFYSGEHKARQLIDCTITIHAQDINTILAYFENKYKNIYLVGHSLGVPSIILADTNNVKKIIYWDPSKGLSDLDMNNYYDSFSDKYILNRGIQVILNKKMISERNEVYNIGKYSKKLKGDCSFIFAGEEKSQYAWLPYLDNYKTRIIHGTTHVFIEKGAEKQLFDYTLELLNN